MMAESCCTVLLITSSTADRAFFRRCLEQDEIYSYDILEAVTGTAGLELGHGSQPEVILLDSSLPDRPALEFLRQFHQCPYIPIILLIEQDDRATIAQALQHGAADYLVKRDLSADLLRRTVRSLVKQGQLQRQIAQQQTTIADLTWQATKSSEQQLNQAIQPEGEAKFRELAEYLRDAFFICTPTLDQYLYISPAIERIWGISTEQLYQNPRCWLELVHPDDWDYFQAHTPLSELISDYDLEYRILRPDGELRWVHVRSYPVRNAQNQVDRLVGICEDITDRKQVELALRQSEAIQAAIIQAIPDLLVRMDQDGRYQELIETEYFHVLLPDKPIQDATVYDVLPVQLAEQRLHYTRLALDTSTLQMYEQTLEVHGQLCYEEVRIVPLGDREVLVIIRDVTERKRSQTERQQAEAALWQSEERWQLAIEGSNDGIWDHNLLTNQHFLSPRCLEIVGYDQQEINSFEKWFALVHPEDQPHLTATFQAYLDRKLPIYTSEYRIRCQDGHYKWLLARGKAFWDDTGTPTRVIGSITDITLRRQAELALQDLNADLEQRVQQRTQALLQSERDLRTIFNNVYDAILIHDLDGTILDLNDRALELWEATREQLIGGSVPDISAPDAPLECLPEIFQRVQAGETLRFEWRDRRLSNDTIFDVEVSLRKVTLNNRTVFMAGVRDISDRKQAERALQESEQRYATLAAAAPVAIFRFDPALNCIYVNDQWSEMTGRPKASALGRGWLDALHPDDRDNLLAQASTQSSITQQGLERGEGRHLLPDGSIRWFYVQVAPEIGLDGGLVGFIGTLTDITARKQIECALAESEAKFRLALDAAQMGTWSCSLQTGRLIWSDRAQEIFGFVPGTFPGDRDTYLALVHPEDREWVIQAIAHTFATNSPYNIEYRIRRLDGEIRWVAVWGIIPAELSVNEQHLIGVVCDITDRKQTEQELQESRNMLKLVLDTIPQRVFWKDRQSRFLGCNSAFANDYHLTLEAIVSKTDHELPWAEWADLYRADDYQVINTGMPKLNYEEPTADLNGNQIWIRSSKIPLTNSQGNVIGILGCYDDITDRKQAEAELQEAVATNQALLNAIPDLIMRISRNGDYRDGIPPHNIALLLPRNELIGKNVWEVLPQELAQQRLATIEEAFQTGLPQIHEYQIFINGEWRYEEARCVICRDDEAMVLIRDITDRKQAELALQQLNLELEQRVSDRTFELQKAMEVAEAANRAKSTFLANMSHELRTPLNAILGFAQLLSRDLSMEPEKRQQLSIINRSGQHLLNLINDILEMSKIEAGRVNFVPNSFALPTLLNMIEDMFQMRAIEKGLRFMIDRDPSLPHYIETDENKLRQVLINLVGNAIKFTTSGQVVVRINRHEPITPSSLANSVIPSHERSSALVLEVAVGDTGIGIDPNELERLFEPFIQSSHRQISQEGTGLGLPISRQFVQLMGGDLTVNSTPGVGSTFTFAIPVQLADAPTGAISLPRHILGLAPGQPSYRILVVEDDATNRLLLVQLLQSVGFQVQVAHNGQEAIVCWQHWQPHLIWMDMRMPIMDGYEATRQIRAMEEQQNRRKKDQVSNQAQENARDHENQPADPPPSPSSSPSPSPPPPTKIIALTANAFEEDRSTVLQAGCDDFVRKPFQDTELLEKIAEHLGVQYLDAAANQVADLTLSSSDLSEAIATLPELPATLLSQLHQATIQLDSQRLASAIEQLPATHFSLAMFLTEKLNNFDFEPILRLLQTVQSQQ